MKTTKYVHCTGKKQNRNFYIKYMYKYMLNSNKITNKVTKYGRMAT